MSTNAQLLSNLPKALQIGPHVLPGRAFLAPMSGITDVGMRRIAARFGAGLVVSEMVASDDFARGTQETRMRSEGAGLGLHNVQLAGCDPFWMAEAARLAQNAGADIIDINMGCPAKRVTGGYSGSALMRDLDHAQRLIEATVQAVSVPVTLKMRLGWDENSLNAPELAQRAQALGVKMVIVHGRTRQQFYKGRADWHAIARVKAAVDIPVVANGDCETLGDALAMLAASGADAIMIGRAALGRPWLAGAITRALAGGGKLQMPTVSEQRAAAQEHLESLLETLGNQAGLRHARKHLSAYAYHAGSGEALRLALVTCEDATNARHLLSQAFDTQQEARAA